MNAIPSDNDISAGLWVVLARAYRSMAMYVEQSVAALGVGLSDFMILEALLHKGPLTMSALCDAVLITGAAMTAAVDRLEKKQLLERVMHETDRRSRTVRLTAEGTSTAKRLYTRHLRDLEELMGYVPIVDRMTARETLKTIGRVAQDRVENGPLNKRKKWR
jgi:MarR family 2-MHQ and catechol resistance regulon transcriptional repressor